MIGAGPGGSAAAYHLARQGVDVLAVDRATFPREKVCGDGLTPRAVSALQRMGVDTDSAAFARHFGLRSYGENGFVIELPWPTLRSYPSYGLVMTRFELDRMLVERAVAVGARLEQGVEARAPVIEDGRVVGALLKDREGRETTVRARHVVAADGASSRFGGAAGVRRDPARAVGIAARRYYRSTRPFEPLLESFLNLEDGAGGYMPGYGWIFFLPDGTLNVGAGLLSTFNQFRSVSAQRLFRLFVGQLPSEWGLTEENALGPVMSGPLPTAMNRRPLAVPGLLVVGDAGGMVNPWNGEGISFAIESGEVAAELIGRALSSGRPAMAQMYPLVLKERYGAYYRLGNGWARWIGNPRFMRFAVRHGFPRRWLMEFAMRIMADLTDGRSGDLNDRVMHALVSATRSE